VSPAKSTEELAWEALDDLEADHASLPPSRGWSPPKYTPLPPTIAPQEEALYRYEEGEEGEARPGKPHVGRDRTPGGSTIEVDIIHYLDPAPAAPGSSSRRRGGSGGIGGSGERSIIPHEVEGIVAWEEASQASSEMSGGEWTSRSKRASLYSRTTHAKLSLPKRPGNSYRKLQAVAKKHKQEGAIATASAGMYQLYREVVGLATPGR